jgi:plastocyanin
MGPFGICPPAKVISVALALCTRPVLSIVFPPVLRRLAPLPRLASLAVLVAATSGPILPRAAAPASPAPALTAPTARSRPGTGRIEGTVEISRSLSIRRPDFRIYADPGIGSVPPVSPANQALAELHNVVVYLEGDTTQLPAPPAVVERLRHGRMAQHDERFVPHVLPVMQGATVDFPNEDEVYHNVFSLSSAAGPDGKGFDLGRYPKGSSRSVTFSKTGTILVFCHIHTEMSAVVLVLANPYFASPDDNHHFVIDDVPEGDYTIVGWHERIVPVTRRVHVAAGQTASVDFNIPLPQGGSSR